MWCSLLTNLIFYQPLLFSPATPLSHMASACYNTTSRPREEVALQPPKHEDNGTGSNNRSREESIGSRQRDDVISLKRARQTAPLIALLPTPPASNTASVMSANSQNSRYFSAIFFSVFSVTVYSKKSLVVLWRMNWMEFLLKSYNMTFVVEFAFILQNEAHFWDF